MAATRVLAPASYAFLRAPAVVAGAFALTAVSPLALLLLTPILLGVPHVVGDLRCLLLSAQARRRGVPLLPLLAPLAALTALAALPLLGFEAWPRAQIACGAAAVLAGVRLASNRASTRAWLTLGVVALALLACAHVAASLVFLAHAHNLIAFGWFFAWARDRREARLALWVYAAASAALLAGAADFPFGATFGELSGERLVAQLAPGASAELGRRLVASFAFAQVAHYGVWIWLLPSEQATTLRGDLGSGGVGLFAACAVVVPLLGLRDPVGTRDAYLALAVFHGWLELAVLSFLLARRFDR